MMTSNLANLLLVLCFALASSESSHGKAIKEVGKSGKAALRSPAKYTPEVQVAASKSGKSESVSHVVREEEGSKASKSAFVDEISLSMSIPEYDDQLVSSHRASGKSEKGGIYAAASTGKSDKQVVGAKSGNKPLTNFFIKSASQDSSKAGKSTELKTVHTETTTVTYVNAVDVEMVKPKSSKAELYAGSKAGQPSVSDVTASSAKANKTNDETSTISSKSNKFHSTSSTVFADATSSAMESSKTTTAATDAIIDGTQSPGTTTQTPGSTSNAATTTAAFDDGTPQDETLLTLAPTPSVGSKEVRYSPPSYMPTANTYEPTAHDKPSSFELSTAGETTIAINPFALHLKADPSTLDIETVRVVTMEHLVHSFRNNPSQYNVNQIKLMLLDPEGERRLASYDDYELYFGGILYFVATDETPSMEEVDGVIEASFTGERLNYFLSLLHEAGLDVDSVALEEVAKLRDGGSEKWKTASIGLAGAVGSLALIATGFRLFNKRRLEMAEDDMDGGRFIIKLKDDAAVEEFPGIACTSTVANTENDLSTIDDRSVPSDVGDLPTLSSRSLDAIEQETFDPRISPLEDPEPPTRYISVFTVKKDVKGKKLEDVDLRALAIAYLSKMLKKYPSTVLLPHNELSLPPITSIRNIPDEMSDLEQYVGNARVDENSGKVMFNLRVESDMPVSQMKPRKKNCGIVLPRPMESNATRNEENDGFEDVAI